MNTITVGPKPTNEDIYIIDSLMTKYYKDDEIYRKRWSFAKLKKYYDINTVNNYLNRFAVHIIRVM